MKNDFSQPQRQSAAGILLIGFKKLRILIQVVIFSILVRIFRSKTDEIITLLIIFGILVVLFMVYAYIYYLRFTFHLNTERQEFIIRKGIFNRSLLTIQLDKIQQVNINQNFIQQAIGVYSLHIDTAGSEGKEVSIEAVDEETALALKAVLLQRKPGEKEATIAPAEAQKITPFLQISNNRLFKVGLSSDYANGLVLLAGLTITLIQKLKDILEAFDQDEESIHEAIRENLSLYAILWTILFFFMVFILVNVLRTFIRYFQFEMSRHKHSFLISAGLFSRKNTLISPEKVQITTYSQNYLQKKMDIFNLRLKQTQAGENEEKASQGKSNLTIPGCNATEKEKILQLILGKIPEGTASLRPDIRFFVLPVIVQIVLPVLIVGGLMLADIVSLSYLSYLFVYKLLVIVMIYRNYTQYRLSIQEDFIIKREGVWDIRHEITQAHKIQAISVSQYPWHRKAGIGHLTLHTAAGPLSFKYGNFTEIRKWVNYWLYLVEKGDRDWM